MQYIASEGTVHACQVQLENANQILVIVSVDIHRKLYRYTAISLYCYAEAHKQRQHSVGFICIET